MKLHILSDLHLETADYIPARPLCDAVVLAGDIDNGVTGVHWAQRHFAVPVIYVSGPNVSPRRR